MNKLNKIIALIFAMIAFAGCQDEELPGFEPPQWRTVQNSEFTASMIAIVQLPSDLVPYYKENDEIAAFIGNECRAVGTMVDGAFYLLVKGRPDEQRDVTFKYYRSGEKFMYETESGTPFEVDGVYGTADNPVILPLKVINHK